MIIASKFLITILSVIVLAEISNRLNPTIGGLLSALPLGTGLSVYYISVDRGIEYVLSGVPWGIAALTSSILFCITYLVMGKHKINGILGILIASFVSIVVFTIWGFILSHLNFNIFKSISIFLVFYILNILLIKRISIPTQKHKKAIKGKKTNIVRGIITGVIILILSKIGSKAGSNWAGILSSFPSTLFALIIVLHYEDGNSKYPSLLKGFSYGISTLVIFYLGCTLTFPKFGLNFGFFLTYLICLVYLYLINILRRFFNSCIYNPLF